MRRALKILPPFYLLLAVSLPAALWSGKRYSSSQILGEVFYLQNYLGNVWGHSWSLAVEEHFYLLLPALLLVLLRRAKRRQTSEPFAPLPVLLGLVALACLGLRSVQAWRHETFDLLTHYVPTHLRIDSLGFGVLISWVYHYRPQLVARLTRPQAALALLLGLALLAPAFAIPLEHPFSYTFGFSLYFLGSGLILVGCLQLEPETPGRAARALAALGRYSYPIYLWHLSVRKLIKVAVARGWLSLSPEASFALYLVASLAAGAVIAKLTETPLLRLRDRLFPSRSEALPPLASEGTPADGEPPQAASRSR